LQNNSTSNDFLFNGFFFFIWFGDDLFITMNKFKVITFTTNVIPAVEPPDKSLVTFDSETVQVQSGKQRRSQFNQY